jgi:hypothetical protein
MTFVRTIVRDVQPYKRTTVPLHSRVRWHLPTICQKELWLMCTFSWQSNALAAPSAADLSIQTEMRVHEPPRTYCLRAAPPDARASAYRISSWVLTCDIVHIYRDTKAWALSHNGAIWTGLETMYTRLNSTETAASGAGNVGEPKLMSQVRRMCEFVRAQISVFLQSEWWRCQYSPAYVAAAVMWLR